MDYLENVKKKLTNIRCGSSSCTNIVIFTICPQKFVVEVHGHDGPIKALLPLGEGLKPQGSKAEKKMVDTWLKGLQDGLSELSKVMNAKEGQLQTALKESQQFER